MGDKKKERKERKKRKKERKKGKKEVEGKQILTSSGADLGGARVGRSSKWEVLLGNCLRRTFSFARWSKHTNAIGTDRLLAMFFDILAGIFE